MNAGEQLRGAGRAVAKHARMTGEDAAELVAVFAQVASRQGKDAAAGLGVRLGRSLERVRRAAAARR